MEAKSKLKLKFAIFEGLEILIPGHNWVDSGLKLRIGDLIKRVILFTL
jgi:hypothetical protein